jgi:hypothetical protein
VSRQLSCAEALDLASNLIDGELMVHQACGPSLVTSPARPISLDTCLGGRLPMTGGVHETSRRRSKQRRPRAFLSSS